MTYVQVTALCRPFHSLECHPMLDFPLTNLDKKRSFVTPPMPRSDRRHKPRQQRARPRRLIARIPADADGCRCRPALRGSPAPHHVQTFATTNPRRGHSPHIDNPLSSLTISTRVSRMFICPDQNGQPPGNRRDRQRGPTRQLGEAVTAARADGRPLATIGTMIGTCRQNLRRSRSTAEGCDARQ